MRTVKEDNRKIIVSHPQHFHADPDPAFYANADPDPVPDPGF
jgi:hypothetical protein